MTEKYSEMSDYPVESYWIEREHAVRRRLLAALTAVLAGLARNGLTPQAKGEILKDWLDELRKEGLIEETELSDLAFYCTVLLSSRRDGTYPQLAKELVLKGRGRG